MSRYVLSPEAPQDLRDIRDYFNREAGLAVSRYVIRTIVSALRVLAATPGAGHFREDLTSEQVKFWQVFSYLVVYDHITRPIGVVRIIHSSRDIPSLLTKGS